MKGLAELVVSLCDLCEAEGRLLEAGILRTVRRAALLSLGLLFGAAALALLLAALYALLTSLLPTPAALALLGCASAAIAVLLLWGARGGAAKGATPAADPAPAEHGQPHEGKAAEAVAEAPHEETAASGHRADDAGDIWADVPPYGHSGRSGESSGKEASPAMPRAAAHMPAGRKNR